jgi:hypothetical protein
VLLAHLLAIASIANFSRLVLRVSLADTVLADKIWSTAIGGIAKMALAPECAVALFGYVRIESQRRQIRQSGVWGRGKVL